MYTFFYPNWSFNCFFFCGVYFMIIRREAWFNPIQQHCNLAAAAGLLQMQNLTKTKHICPHFNAPLWQPVAFIDFTHDNNPVP